MSTAQADAVSHVRGRRARAIAASLAVGLLVSAWVTPAAAQSTPAQSEEAAKNGGDTEKTVTQLMRKGITEYRKKNFAAAHEAFLNAWKLRQHTAIAASLADAEMQLGRYRDAAEHWSYYVKNLEPDRETQRAEARAQLDECHKHVGRLVITLNPKTAVVLINEKSFSESGITPNDLAAEGPAPIDTAIFELWVEPGRYAMRALELGKKSPVENVTIAAGETKTISLLAKTPPKPSPPPKLIVPVKRPTTKTESTVDSDAKTIAIIGGGLLTIGAATVGIGYTVAANSHQTEADRLTAEAAREGDPALFPNVCYRGAASRPVVCNSLKKENQSVEASTNIAVAAFVGAGVLGMATVATYFLWPDAEPSPSHKSVVVAPWVHGDARGAQLQAAF